MAPDAVDHPPPTSRQNGLAEIAPHPATPYLVHVINAISAEQSEGVPPLLSSLPSVQFSPQAPDPPKTDRISAAPSYRSYSPHPSYSPAPAPDPVSPSVEDPEPVEGHDIPLLTPEEKRRILARIVRVNPLDCFDESGAFDLARAKKVLPPGAIRHIAIHETTRPNAEGQPVTERRIQVRLVDPLSALRLDDLLEKRRERPTSHSNSSSTSKKFTRRDFNLLTEKTMALEDANHSIELLEKAIAEADDRELQLSKELEEKDRQLLQTLSLSNGSETLSLSNESQTLSKAEGDAAQRDTGCQPVQEKAEASTSDPNSQTLSQTLNSAEGDTLSEAERIAKKRRESAARSLEREIEHARNTSGHGAFTNWLRRRGLDPANYPSPPLPTKPYSARPPP